jgi:hypothetical protein
MPVPVKDVLTGSSNGTPIPVAAVATPGTTIHTAGATGYENIWLWAANVTGSPATLTLEWGGVADPGDHLVKEYSIPANSLPIPIATGHQIDGSVVIGAFSGTASAINITGYIIAVR